LVVNLNNKKVIPTWAIFLLGQFIGMIFLLKQNIGLFFLITCGSWLFHQCLSINGDCRNKKRRYRNLIVPVLVVLGYLVFGIIFYLVSTKLDSKIYFLAPYAIYVALLGTLVFKGSLVVEKGLFFFNGSVLFVSTMLLPLTVFIYFGSVIGYADYGYSLFGMGLRAREIWDVGIVTTLLDRISSSVGLWQAYHLAVITSMLCVPIVVNASAVLLMLYKYIFDKDKKELLTLIQISGLSIVGIFTLYPLEGVHIISTKLFISLFVGGFLITAIVKTNKRTFNKIVALALLLICILSGRHFYVYLNTEYVDGGTVLDRVVSMPMRTQIAEELNRQIEVISRNVIKEPYYIIDSSGADLMSVAALIGTMKPQYYVEMRDGILDNRVVNAIIEDLETRDWVLVNSSDFDNRKSEDSDVHLRELLQYIDGKYDIVDAYKKPADGSRYTGGLVSFYVMGAKQFE